MNPRPPRKQTGTLTEDPKKMKKKNLKKIQLPKSLLQELNSNSLVKISKPRVKKKLEKPWTRQEEKREFTRQELEQDNLQEIFDFDFYKQEEKDLISDSEFLKEKRNSKNSRESRVINPNESKEKEKNESKEKEKKEKKENESMVGLKEKVAVGKQPAPLVGVAVGKHPAPLVVTPRVGIKRILNKLTFENLEFSLKEISKLFQENSRRVISNEIVSVFLEISKTEFTSLQVIVLNGFLTVIFHMVGLEFGSLLVEGIILNLQELQDQRECPLVSSFNVSLSYLYIFNVISCGLIYDVIKSCLQTLHEHDVEILLKILRIAGQKIRNDDPNALREIIEILNIKLLEKKDQSTRLKFMAESIMDLKNNRVRRKFDQNDDVVRLKKFIQNYLAKISVSQIEPLRFGVGDILAIGEKGRWWLVGSAWAGVEPTLPSLPVAEAVNQELYSLARSQKMNTDVRKTIFVTIMSSEVR